MARYKATHGHSGSRRTGGIWAVLPSRTYMSWQSMRARVSGKHSNSRYYAGYSVDPRWDKFENFLADMGDRPDGMSLDRIDRSKDYGPSNCRWATWSQQSKNRRPFTRVKSRRYSQNGRSLTIDQWSKETGLSRSVLHQRARRGWSVERMLTTPVNTSRQSRGARLEESSCD